MHTTPGPSTAENPRWHVAIGTGQVDVMVSTSAGRHALSVRQPADLIAAVPHLLGFAPSESVVLIALEGHRRRYVRHAARADLPDQADTADLCERLLRISIRPDVAAVAIVVVAGTDGAGTRPPPRRDVVDAITMAIPGGVEVVCAVWTERIAPGQPWRCYDCADHRGAIPDPASSPLAVASTMDGWVTFASRAELAALITPDDPEALRRRSALLDRAIIAFQPGSKQERKPIDDWVVVTDAVRAAGRRRHALTDDDVVRLTMALADPLVRDAAFSFAGTPQAAAAERLWTLLTRASPDPDVAEPAALLAYCALVRGQGALANVALERALGAWPGHRMAGYLAVAVREGLAPVDFVALLETANAARDSLIRGSG